MQWQRSLTGIERANCVAKLTCKDPMRGMQQLLTSLCLARYFKLYTSAWSIHATHDLRLDGRVWRCTPCQKQGPLDNPGTRWSTCCRSGSQLHSSSCFRKIDRQETTLLRAALKLSPLVAKSPNLQTYWKSSPNQPTRKRAGHGHWPAAWVGLALTSLRTGLAVLAVRLSVYF